MREFKSFEDAINYRKTCPFCKGKVEMKANDYFSEMGDVSEALPTTIKDGIYYGAVIFNCFYCNCFYYCVQMLVDIATNRIIGMFLNGENIKDSGSEVRVSLYNNYSSNQSECTFWRKYTISTSKPLPLIPIDLDNPKDALERVKKLLVFV